MWNRSGFHPRAFDIYIIHVNDVLNILDCENDIFLYADDMLIVSRDKDVEQMMVSLQRKMDKIYKWCLSSRLTRGKLNIW